MKYVSRSRIVSASIGVISIFSVAGQQPATTFTTRSDMVLVPVEVRHHGNHLPGLKLDAFSVKQDGKLQSLVFLDEIRTKDAPPSKRASADQEFTNELRGDLASTRYTVIAIDRVNTTTMDLNRVREGLLKFLKSSANEQQPIRILGLNMSRIDIIQDFTSNPAVLAAALIRYSSGSGKVAPASDPSMDDVKRVSDALAAAMMSGENPSAGAAQMRAAQDQQDMAEGENRFRDRNSRISALEGLRAVAASLAGFPGRKSLVWISSGYPFTGETSAARDAVGKGFEGVGHNPSGILEATGIDEYTMRLLNTANVAVYPVDARGPINTAYQIIDPSIKNSPTRARELYMQAVEDDMMMTFHHLASATGGRACTGRADLSGCFSDAMEDSRDYYMLGYYAKRDELKPGWHKLDVEVNEKGVSVRARAGFIVSGISEKQLTDADIGANLFSKLVNPGLPFVGRWISVRSSGADRVANVELKIQGTNNLLNGDNLLNMEIAAVARRPDGSVAAQFAQHLERHLPKDAATQLKQQGLTYTNKLELAAGDYMIRFAIRDNNTGRMGAVSTPLHVD